LFKKKLKYLYNLFLDMSEPSAISRKIILKEYLTLNSQYRLIASEMIVKCGQCDAVKACAQPNNIDVTAIQTALDAAKTECDATQQRYVVAFGLVASP
jgi:hypothetical protein